MAMNYKAAGVDVEAGYKAVSLMKEHVKGTLRKEVITDLGGFSGLFSLGSYAMEEPVLVSGTDGVGTKLKIAFLMDRHDTIGMDCVAMCANDILCCGAEPLFFLDYIACGKNKPEKIANIVKGVAAGCKEAGMALIGGETAEMPGFYPEDEYDVAGFAVGIVDRKKIIDGTSIKEGDVLLGIPSSGIHSNGYSLVRKLVEPTVEKVNQYMEEFGCTLGAELLRPTKIYVKEVQALQKEVRIKGMGHITGGGFIENIPRILPKGYHAHVQRGSWPVLPIFSWLQQLGNVEEKDMYNTFNMGIGLVIVIDPSEVDKAQKILQSMGEKSYVIGEVNAGEAGIQLC